MLLLNLRVSRNRLAVAGFLLLLIALMCVSYGAAAEEMPQNGVDLSRRLAFLDGFGHHADGESEVSKSVVIPAEFNDVYENYNALQKLQGYDLSRYKGQAVTHYTYALVNYGETDVYAHLLVLDGTVIGGDIASLRLDGFMEGFGGQRCN